MMSTIEAALADLKEPKSPVDGDCIRYAEMVTQHLREAGLPARAVSVWGWADHSGGVVAFVHQATAVQTIVIDFTARQFNPDLPARWVSYSLRYRLRLTRAAGVKDVTIREE